MLTKRRIVVAGLDTPVRSIANDRMPSDHLDIAEFDEDPNVDSTAHVDLVIFCAPTDLDQTQALWATLRPHVGESTPMVRCASRNGYLLIKPLLGNAVQSMIIMPFDARGLRQQLGELDLGF
jgi:hypothetical protein